VDETLLGTVDVTAGIKEGGALIINSKKTPEEIQRKLPEYGGRVCVVDAEKISVETLGKNYPNTPMLAAVVKGSGVIDEHQFVKDMEESFGHKFATKPEVVAGNMLALKKAMEEVKEV
jgi:pyruvate ferredoxin oxidoreductase gamma subunit